MTKEDVIKLVAKRAGYIPEGVQLCLESFFSVVKDSMEEGNNIYIRGFGSFIHKKRAEKKARNISKNTAVIIKEHYIPYFKPCKEFVDKITIPKEQTKPDKRRKKGTDLG